MSIAIFDGVLRRDIFGLIIREKDGPEIHVVPEKSQSLAFMRIDQDITCGHTAYAFPGRSVIPVTEMQVCNRIDSVAFVFVDKLVQFTGRRIHSALFKVFFALESVMSGFFVKRDLIDLVLHFQIPAFSS